MKSNSQRRRGIRAGVVALVTSLNVAGMGADYPNDQPVTGLETWPVGLSRMINATNRVHGFFINAEDTFFFAGTLTNFTSFPQDYASPRVHLRHLRDTPFVNRVSIQPAVIPTTTTTWT